VAGGLDSTAISVHGYGKANPVATNTTPDGRQQNRRVEIVVLGAGKLADLIGSRAPATQLPDTSAGARPGSPADTAMPSTAAPPPPPRDSTGRPSSDSSRHP
jgi:hypothetical protein